jgi:ABC-type amino acid transport substrate-binding protein/CheY-like chemotaxis protein/nitrogen-specific signal transduction histidine kinase
MNWNERNYSNHSHRRQDRHTALWGLRYALPPYLSVLILLLFAIIPSPGFSAQQQVLKVGIYDQAPVMFLDENGNAAGFAVDIMNEIAAREDWSLNYVNDEWAELLEKLRTKKIDLLMGIAYTDKRDQYLDFSGMALFTTYAVISTHEDSKLERISDLDGKTIAVLKGDKTAEDFKQHSLRFGIQPILREVDTFTEAFQLLQSREVLGVGSPVNYAIHHAKKFNAQITPIEFGYTSSTIAFPKGYHQEIRKTIDNYLWQWKTDKSSIYYQIYDRWIVTRHKGATDEIVFSEEETRWLRAHPSLRFAVNSQLSPRHFIDQDNQLKGVSIDYMNLLGARLDIEFDYIYSDGPSALERVRRHEVDGVINVAFVDDHKPYINFTTFYNTYPLSVVAHQNEANIEILDALGKHKVGVVTQTPAQAYLKTNQPDIEQVLYQTHKDALLALTENEVDAVLGVYDQLNALIQDRGLIDFRPIYTKYIHPAGQEYLGVRNDDPILLSVLNKAIASITFEERKEITRKWFTAEFPVWVDTTKETSKVNLTLEESSWLAEHPTIRVVMSADSAPVEFRDDKGRYQGIAVEYLQRLEELLGIRLEIADGVSWNEGVAAIGDKRLDMVTSMARTKEREDFALFTEPYLSVPVNIFARNDVSYIGNLENLAGKRVAVVEGYAPAEWMRRDHPKIRQVPIESTTDVLKMVAAGKVDAFVGNVVGTSYYLGKLRINTVRVAGETPYSADISMAVRDDWPLFAGILQKALNAIEQPERDSFFNRWMSIRYEVEADYTLFWWFSALGAIVLALFLYWNRRLAGEIATRQQTEMALKEAKETAESANRAKSTFLANMSHELRTPLNAILGFSEMMARDSSINTKQIDSLNIINRSGQHLLGLINNVLDMSKIEAGRTELEAAPLDLHQLLQEIGDMFRLRAETKDLAFTLELSPGLPQYVLLDMSKLRQVFINLLGNAVTITEAGGVAMRADAEALPNGNWQLRFEVADTGTGIPADEVETIFEAFAQAGHSPAEQQGTGLGLAISRQFIQLMGGEITVESTPGEGSVFRFELPAEATDANNVAQPHEGMGQRVVGLATDGPEWRILIVEDESDNRLVLSSLFESVGFSVREAVNGEEAIQQFQDWQPQLIWMDMRMPVMDGYKATRRIRELPGGKEVKILALTASAFKEQEELILAAGCDAVLHKPYREQALFAAMAEQLNLHYVYEEDSELQSQRALPKLDAKDLLNLPAEWLDEFLTAAQLGDIDALLSLTKTLPASESETKAKLERYINEFQLEHLIKVFEKK